MDVTCTNNPNKVIKIDEIIMAVPILPIHTIGAVEKENIPSIALNMGGMSNQVFLLAFHELIIMWPVAFILEYFFVDKLAHYFAFKVVTPKDRPFFITLAISFYIICIMCPIMSLIATILFKTPGVQIISVWFMTILFNFPMAFFWQICYCGPFVRWIFGKLFH